jgi:hypothetical protein
MDQTTRIRDVLAARGPILGADLCDASEMEPLAAWQTCTLDPAITVSRVGRRYLRLDAATDGGARLSPSIGREFLTYSIVWASGDGDRAQASLDELRSKIAEISDIKRGVARSIVKSVLRHVMVESGAAIDAAFLLAGDVAYGMAHDSPRPEISTNRLIRGSDLDVVVVCADNVPESVLERLDEAMLDCKWRLLSAPRDREELDYVIKTVTRAGEQLTSGDPRDIIAAKILSESEFIGGREEIYAAITQLIHESDIEQRLEALTRQAAQERERAEARLKIGSSDPNDSRLFIGTEEQTELP